MAVAAHASDAAAMSDTSTCCARRDDTNSIVCCFRYVWIADSLCRLRARSGWRLDITNAVSSIGAAGETLPSLLIESGYSRRFEKEADRAAGTYLIRMGWGTASLQNVLGRIAKTAPIHPAFALFSSHPDLEERIGYLEKMDRIR